MIKGWDFYSNYLLGFAIIRLASASPVGSLDWKVIKAVEEKALSFF